jgi:glycine dehydrogenase subunit 1
MTAATIHLALLGPTGLARVARACIARTNDLVAALGQLPGVRAAFAGPRFHEAVLKLDRPVAPLLESLASEGIIGGFDLSRDYPELGDALLVCATETRTRADIETYARALVRALGRPKAA